MLDREISVNKWVINFLWARSNFSGIYSFPTVKMENEIADTPS